MNVHPWATRGLAVVLTGTCWAQVTTRVSVSASGVQGSQDAYYPVLSTDGRFVAFSSASWNLVPGDSNGVTDVFVRDRQTGTVELASVGSGGFQSNSVSYVASITADGRFVAFESLATNLSPGDFPAAYDVFLRDRQADTTERISVDSNELPGNQDSGAPDVSADGRFVTFWSRATNLVPGDTNGVTDIFLRDRLLGTTERLNVGPGNAQGNGHSDFGFTSVSADGRFVAFHSSASNLVAADTNASRDVFVRDRLNGTTERVSVDSTGVQANAETGYPSMSADGRFVAFYGTASNLVPGDTNGVVDAFVHDRQTGTTELVNVSSGGVHGNFDSFYASISSDGRYVAFASGSTNLVPGDTNGRHDTYVRDRQLGTTERASFGVSGVQPNGDCHPSFVSISDDGRFVSFGGDATNLVPGDTNGFLDAFVRDRFGGTSFTSFCEPGTGGAISCPCANPPAGAGRGCENSAGTGGAVLTASGASSLTSDSLVFTSTGQTPTELCIVVQGNVSIPGGLVYGQGVRCVGGTLKRLYKRLASGGGVTAPLLFAGELPVSQRSAALGDAILAGQTRWYYVYYRDPSILGGCSVSQDFNATQAGEVIWGP